MATLETDRFYYEPNYEVIQEQCDRAISRNPSLRPVVMTAVKNLRRGKASLESVNVRRAFILFDRAMKGISGIHIPELEAAITYFMGIIVLSARDDRPETEDMLTSTFDYAFSQTCDHRLVLHGYNLLMMHYLSSNNCDKVIELAKATEKVAGVLPESAEKTYIKAAALYNMGEAHYRKREFVQAIPCLQTALTGFQTLSMEQEAAKCRGLLGQTRIAVADIDDGLNDIEKSLKVFMDSGNETEAAFLMQGRATVYSAHGRKKEAIQELKKALAIYRRQGDAFEINTALSLLAEFEGQADG